MKGSFKIGHVTSIGIYQHFTFFSARMGGSELPAKSPELVCGRRRCRVHDCVVRRCRASRTEARFDGQKVRYSDVRYHSATNRRRCALGADAIAATLAVGIKTRSATTVIATFIAGPASATCSSCTGFPHDGSQLLDGYLRKQASKRAIKQNRFFPTFRSLV